jgi:aminoglycoside phosphotransferase (APT) family kinase protein
MALQDATQPQLDFARRPAQVRALIAKAVPSLFPGHTLTALEQQYTRYKAGKEHVGLYRVELDPPVDGAAPVLTVIFGQRKRLIRGYERLPNNGEGHSALLLREGSCLIEVFPADFELPSLWDAADRSRASALLRRLHVDGNAFTVTRIEVLRYRPGRRCVLRYELEREDGSRTELVGKLYDDAGRACAVADKLAALAKQQTNEIRLPIAVADPDDASLLLMTHMRGTNLGDQIENNMSRQENQAAVRAAASALSRFHRFELSTTQRRSLRTELDNLLQRIERLHAVAPALAEDIQALLQQVNQLLDSLPQAKDCVIHGEYKPNQLLLDDGSVAVVDLDRACLGDPAIDVGNFMAVLRKEVVFEGHTHLEDLDRVFLATYEEQATRVDGLAERAHVFEVISFLRMLTRYFERAPQAYERRGSKWPPLALLTEARRSLAAL